MAIDDTPDTSGEPGGFFSREELIQQNARLREELHRQREENTFLAGMLAECYEHLPVEESVARPTFPISDAAIDLFEALPQAFMLDAALDAAERLGQTLEEAARHVRTYLAEEMIVQDAERARFVKTGRKPYF